MKITIENKTIDTDVFYDVSIGLQNNLENPRAWYVDFPVIEPVRSENFVGSVAEGNSVNFNNISFNPHGHGTHIECLGHITKKVFSVNQLFKDYFVKATLVTITPQNIFNTEFQQEDRVILKEQLEAVLTHETDCLMIRTLPNEKEKLHRNYSNTNFSYLDVHCVEIMEKYNVRHLIVDQPSVDRENDKGRLAFHKAFWKTENDAPRYHSAIIEFAYFADEIPDGDYFVNIQVAPIENDASLCRPILFPIQEN